MIIERRTWLGGLASSCFWTLAVGVAPGCAPDPPTNVTGTGGSSVAGHPGSGGVGTGGAVAGTVGRGDAGVAGAGGWPTGAGGGGGGSTGGGPGNGATGGVGDGAVYVAPNGGDSNPGTLALPLRTLARARDLMRGLLATTVLLAAAPVAAAPRPLISYFQPMPIVGKLSTTVWGASTVGPRDPANGLEDSGSSGGVGPQQQTNYYWDGKIIKGEDGKYHLYASHWPHKDGFGPPATASGTGWETSVPMQAVSDNLMGPYVTQGDCYTHNQQGTAQGHNTTALVAPSGAAPYTLSVGEIVPGQMFSSPSANGPWTLLGATNTNSNGHGGCDNLTSNFAFTVGPDHRFWATARAGCVMDSDQALGPYKVETDSVLPNLENNDNGDAEDEAIWYSGGYFHIVYNYWNVQRAYHVMSKDGVTNWTSTGLAYQASQSPANSNSNWLRYADGTVNQWHNMERVGVYQEGGHVAAFSFAVTDVDKNSSAVNSGGSKILVVPFNGVQFDCDNGDSASCAEAAGGHGGVGGSAAGGSGGRAGASGAGGLGGGPGGTGGAAGRGGSGGDAGVAGNNGAGEGVAGGHGGATAGGGGAGSIPAGTGGRGGGAGGYATAGASGSGGCACDIGVGADSLRSSLLFLAAVTFVLRRQSRRRRRYAHCRNLWWPKSQSGGSSGLRIAMVKPNDGRERDDATGFGGVDSPGNRRVTVERHVRPVRHAPDPCFCLVENATRRQSGQSAWRSIEARSSTNASDSCCCRRRRR